MKEKLIFTLLIESDPKVVATGGSSRNSLTKLLCAIKIKVYLMTTFSFLTLIIHCDTDFYKKNITYLLINTTNIT